MRARITILLLFAILFSFTCLAQTNFEKHFTKKSLRIDFALSGNWDFQAAAIQQLREEPVWDGTVKNMIDTIGYRGYYINVYDKAGKELIYSRGFNTLFEEWRSTEHAQTLIFFLFILTLLFRGCPSKFVVRFVGEDRRIKLSEKLNFKELTQKSIRKNIIFTY